MFKEAVDKKYFWYWPAIALALLFLIAVIQVARVNRKPREAPVAEIYSPSGPLIQKDLKIPPQDFYATRINLNRRAKLSGTFRTESIASRVSVLVMDEKSFNNWRLDQNYSAITQTGFVPGGKVAPVLEPGVYYLVIDNRRNDTPRALTADFALE